MFMENILVIKPVWNPLNEHTSLVIDSDGYIEKDIKMFREDLFCKTAKCLMDKGMLNLA